MKRILGLLLVLLLGGLSAGVACAHIAPDAEVEKSFLWKVTGRSATVFVLGSVHVLRPDVLASSPAIEQAFTASDVVVFEVEMDQMGAAAVKMLSQGVLPDGQSLADVLPPELYQETAQRLSKAGLDIATLGRMKPWMVALTLTSFELITAGFSPESGIDIQLYNRARDADKQVQALETIDFQVSLFANLTPAQSETFLRYTLADLETVVPLLDDITAAWSRGDVTQIEGLLTEGFDEFPELFEKVVDERNARWMVSLEELLGGDETVMVVVGALHLVGDAGLIARLRDAGFKVEQQ